MLWLGIRKLERFQVTGGITGDDLMMTAPQLLPESLARWFRSRPRGVFLNLIRKELNLQRPIWALTVLAACGWLGVTPFGDLSKVLNWQNSPSLGATIAMVLLGCLSMVIAVLAGCVSLGEERTSGTHSWQLTLPVSVRRQWLIKLAMAVTTSLVCGAGVPILVIIAVGRFRGFGLTPAEAMIWFGYMFLLTVASFWCACAVNGTLPAVAWVFPAMGAVYLSGEYGTWVGHQMIHVRFFGAHSVGTLLLLIVPPAVFAVIQSDRMFRTQPQANMLGMVRSLLALCLVVFLSSFAV
jgi:hypothetical protein